MFEGGMRADRSIQPVYAFVRASLSPEAAEKPFTFYQPPRTTFPERPVPQPPAKKHINPAMKARVIAPANSGPMRGPNAAGLAGGTGGNESLSELGLVPQSVLLVRWDDGEMNCEWPSVSGRRAALPVGSGVVTIQSSVLAASESIGVS